MAYTPKTWIDGEIAHASEMNHIEQGIADADQAATAAQETAEEAEAMIADLKSALIAELNPANLTGWELGSFLSNGADYASDKRIRNKTKVGMSEGTELIKCDDGYKFLVLAYDAGGTCLGILKTSGSFTTTDSGDVRWLQEFPCYKYPTYEFKVALSTEPDSTSITTADGAHCFVYNATDETLTVEGKAADAKAVGEKFAEDEALFDDVVLDRFEEYTSQNLIVSDASLTSGYVAKGGTIGTNSAYLYTDYIPVSPNDVLRVYSVKQGVFNTESFRFMCCYNSSKSVMSEAGSNSDVATFTVPSGVAFVRATVYAGGGREKYMLTANKVMTAYEPYGTKYIISEDFLTAETIKTLNGIKTGNFACALPQTRVYQTVGLPQKWYNKSMVTPENSYIFVSIGQQYVNQANDGVSFPNIETLSSENGYTFTWRNAFLNWIKYGDAGTGLGWSRRIVAENLSDCSLLAIGDSTVDHDVMTASMLSHFAEQGHTLTLFGTLGSGANKNEGRAGWKASDYLTDKQYSGVTNPFYNPTSETFDFSYYMTNQGYSGVDFVVLQLGINDLYHNHTPSAIESTWASIKTMIDSILAYNNGIKIILNLPTTPNGNQSQLAQPEFSYRNIVVRYNEYAMAHALSVYGTAKVRCSYCHLILDPYTEIRDNVHPTDAGYGKMALEVVNQINCWQNGQ